MSDNMNFVFFYPDEMRAESVGCYGHPLVQTPNFDRVAAEGTRFDQCHVQHTVCSPSRCSIMTGWYPHSAGHRTLWHLLRPHEPSLFRYLKEAGYHIEWHGKNDLYSPESFPLTVDNFACEGGTHAGPVAFGPDEPGFYSFLHEAADGPLEDSADMHKTQAGIDFLRARQPGDKPFALYLPLSLPHPAYGAPEPYHDMYDPADLPPLRPAGMPNKPDFHELIRQYRQLDEMPEGRLEKIQAVYLGMISYSDWILGRLLEALDETGLAENTTVFLFADHGDWAGDYGLVEKWPSGLDDTLTRVPFIVRTPGGKAGHVVEEPIEIFDLMPTVLELAGLEADHVHFARSQVAQLHGAPGDPERAVFAEGGYDPHEPHCFEGKGTRFDIGSQRQGAYYPKGLQQQEHPESVCRSTMIRTMTHKLTSRTNGQNELYALVDDPGELHNLYDDPTHAEVRAQLEARLLRWHIETADCVPHDPDPRGLP